MTVILVLIPSIEVTGMYYRKLNVQIFGGVVAKAIREC